MPKAKMSEPAFRALVGQLDSIDEQIDFLQDQKIAMVKGFDLTMPAYYTRRKSMGLNTKVLERGED